jgi:hypothetical protein
MNCEEVKELLSEYLDGVLDPKTKTLVDEHLSACKGCQEELASLKALAHELGSLESIAPPRDFLDQLHERMEQRSPFPKILRALFVPLRLKIPLEFAGAVAMAILVLSLLHIQQGSYRTAEAPVSLTKERVSEKGALESRQEDLKDEAFKPQRAHRTAISGKLPQKKEQIELALIVKPALVPETPAPGSAMKAAPSLSAHPGIDENDEDFLLRLTGIIEHVGGSVVSIDYEKSSTRPESIHAEIPSEHLTIVYSRLGELGDLQGAPGAVTGNEQGLIKVRIRLLPSSR